jgi:hypothetical protein
VFNSCLSCLVLCKSVVLLLVCIFDSLGFLAMPLFFTNSLCGYDDVDEWYASHVYGEALGIVTTCFRLCLQLCCQRNVCNFVELLTYTYNVLWRCHVMFLHVWVLASGFDSYLSSRVPQ